MNEGQKFGLYFHIPFCKSKCFYCDFNSYPGSGHMIPRYFKALESEMRTYANLNSMPCVDTIFFGGGTPSLIDPSYIEKIMILCRRIWNISNHAEISIETNPGSLTLEKLNAYRRMGINRLSIGMQASEDRHLKLLGRIHNYEEFVANYHQAREAGFENINVDLIFGFPEQTMEDWIQTLERVTGLGPEHISGYSLKVEEGTPLESFIESGRMKAAEDELDREMYHYAVAYLAAKGYHQYEISNFAREGFECRHNLLYWKTGQYIGFGAGAHSYFNDQRYSNECSLEQYCGKIEEKRSAVIETYDIDEEERMKEFMIMQLRLIRGADSSDFRARFHKNMEDVYAAQIRSLTQKGLIELQEGFIRLTKKGLDLANQVMMEFI